MLFNHRLISAVFYKRCRIRCMPLFCNAVYLRTGIELQSKAHQACPNSAYTVQSTEKIQNAGFQCLL
ncbi:hypothetical protein BEN74_10790 [Acinetobacter sp. WCHAc010034]|nr:hypothetical protein BEN74_10790 [Acinetobacter sp. WCHAc010034]